MAGLVVCTGRFLSNSEEGKDGNKTLQRVQP